MTGGGLPAYEPPQDLPAEQAVLGAVLLSADVARHLLPRLRPEQFYRPAHGELLSVMQHLHHRGEPVDPLTVHAELRRRGRVEFGERKAAVVLHDLLAATPTVANAGYYAAIVTDVAARRRAVEAGVRLVQLAGDGQGDLDALMSSAVHELACVRAAVERHHALVPPVREESADERPLRAVVDADTGRGA
jgi:replicative DNA helicase